MISALYFSVSLIVGAVFIRNVNSDFTEEKRKEDENFIREQFAKVTTNQTYLLSDLTNVTGVANWTAPEYIQRNFPFYMAGTDYDDRPLWVVEIGKYDFRSALDHGMEADVEKWILKLAYELYKSRMEVGADEIAIIFDFEGFTLRQFSHLPSLALMIRTVRKLSNFARARLGNAVVVNASYLTRTFVNLVRPIWGEVFDKTEIFGTNKELWTAQMRTLFPKESLPPWYGGKGKTADYKPIKTFG